MKLLAYLLSVVIAMQVSTSKASCLDDVARFAAEICGQINTSGRSVVTDARGNLDISISNIVRRVVGSGSASVNGGRLVEIYENVLREQLGAELFNVRDCRQKMANVAIDRVCKEPKGPMRRPSINSPGGGFWGNWADSESYCPSETYGYAFRLKVELPRGGDLADDTALNAIQLRCRSQEENEGQVIQSDPGPWGTWGHWAQCPPRMFLFAYRLKVEPDQGPDVDGGNDDTAANDIESYCRRHQSAQVPTKSNALRADNGGRWGVYNSIASCPNQTSICGFMTRLEPPLGEGDNNDDTALNDVRFHCCD